MVKALAYLKMENDHALDRLNYSVCRYYLHTYLPWLNLKQYLRHYNWGSLDWFHIWYPVYLKWRILSQTSREGSGKNIIFWFFLLGFKYTLRTCFESKNFLPKSCPELSNQVFSFSACQIFLVRYYISKYIRNKKIEKNVKFGRLKNWIPDCSAQDSFWQKLFWLKTWTQGVLQAK